MLLIEELHIIKNDIAQIKEYIINIPEWIPMSDKLAESYGYASSNGLRLWCLRNIHPDFFKKFGKSYHIHKSVVARIRQK